MILGITADVGLYQCFLDNLKALGFEVLLLCDDDYFRYRNRKQQVISFIRRTFFKDKTYKKNLQKSYKTAAYLDLLNQAPNAFDYALFVRPDLFDQQVIRLAGQKSNALYAYQWDGLNRFKDIYQIIPLFKKFYVFDPQDAAENPGVFLSHNFYFDCYPGLFANKDIQYDAYYLGSYDSRIETTLRICEALYAKGLRLNIIIKCSKSKVKRLKAYPYITIIHESLAYKDNLAHVDHARLLLDIGHASMHKGLSFRPFEALGYGKKLITTNSSVAGYDFYDPQNVLVWDENSGIPDGFLQSEGKKPSDAIAKKYSFEGWLRQILES